MLLVERRGQGFAARFVSKCGFIDCAGLRDPATAGHLTAVFREGGKEQVRSLTREAAARPDGLVRRRRLVSFDRTSAVSDAVLVTVPLLEETLEAPRASRVRALKRHLVASLRALRIAKRPERLIQKATPEPAGFAAAVLAAGCATCRGHCCMGGGEHAYIDERTMARVRRDNPDHDASAIIRLYLKRLALRCRIADPVCFMVRRAARWIARCGRNYAMRIIATDCRTS